MNTEPLFCTLGSVDIAALIESAKQSVCYAAPGVQLNVAKAMVGVANRLSADMLTVCLDFDERVMRMGYGEVSAVELLQAAYVNVRNAPGLRTALVIVDNAGFIFTPTALYLEAEPGADGAPNAIRMSGEQVSEALARLSPGAKAIASAQAKTPEEKNRIDALPVDVGSEPVSKERLAAVVNNLKDAPPVRFDLARQVRVFEPYLQYVELKLTGASIQRHRLTVPQVLIQNMGNDKDLEDRLRTTFELIEKDSKLSSKKLEDKLNEIRKNFTRLLGKDHGRVFLKAAKPTLTNRLELFRQDLEAHQATVKSDLQKQIDESRKKIIDHYIPGVMAQPPDAFMGQLIDAEPSNDNVQKWLNRIFEPVFPSAESLVQDMKLNERFMDVTFETLNRKDFLESVKAAFPDVDWDSTYKEFKAAGETNSESLAETLD